MFLCSPAALRLTPCCPCPVPAHRSTSAAARTSAAKRRSGGTAAAATAAAAAAAVVAAATAAAVTAATRTMAAWGRLCASAGSCQCEECSVCRSMRELVPFRLNVRACSSPCVDAGASSLCPPLCTAPHGKGCCTLLLSAGQCLQNADVHASVPRTALPNVLPDVGRGCSYMWRGLGSCAPPPVAQQQSRSRAAVHNTMNKGQLSTRG